MHILHVYINKSVKYGAKIKSVLRSKVLKTTGSFTLFYIALYDPAIH